LISQNSDCRDTVLIDLSAFEWFLLSRVGFFSMYPIKCQEKNAQSKSLEWKMEE